MAAQGSGKKRRLFWFDPRFAIGLALIAASVLGVAALVASADSSIDVLAARTTLTPGQRVTAADLVPTSVRAGHVEKLYLRVGDIPASGVIVTRAVTRGELVPSSAVGRSTGSHLASIVVSANTPLAEAIEPGARVDVWSARQVESGQFDAPEVIASSAMVVRLVDQKNLVASGSGSSVELLIPRSATASVLEAIANGAALSVVPVDLPLGG